MLRPKKINFKGVVERHSDAAELVQKPADVALVSRGVIRSLAIRCPDGCGEVISVNLDERAGAAWRLFHRHEKLSLYPSVWRESGCKAHFILWNDHLIWCDGYDSPSWSNDELKSRIREILPNSSQDYVHFEAIAAQLDIVPWEALWACQSLEKDKAAVSSMKGSRFRKAQPSSSGKSHRIDRKA
ncbi:MAG TPA: DUF6527 family protein [Pseudolabrys sp.]|nr:DUF6527 family protein [Pseudolabrys sp.]